MAVSPVWDINEWLYHPAEEIIVDAQNNVLTEAEAAVTPGAEVIHVPAGPLYELLQPRNTPSVVPFFPIQAQPESQVPFFRYVTRGNAHDTMWWLRTDAVSYVLHDDNIERATGINYALTEALGRLDDSAHEVNTYFELPGKHSDFFFHYCKYNATLTPEAPTQESGRVQFVTAVDVSYTPKVIRTMFS